MIGGEIDICSECAAHVDGITVTLDDLEPFHSVKACDRCGSTLSGYRFAAVAWAHLNQAVQGFRP